MTRPLVRGIAIDPEGSRDLDDAVWVERTPDGFVVQVSIADATAWVRIGTQADRQAHERLVSRYYSNGTVHLLPEQIATRSASLLPGYPRKALTLSIYLDEMFAIIGEPKIRLTHIQSDRLTYSQIPVVLHNPAHPLFEQVNLLHIVAKGLARMRGRFAPLPFYRLPKGLVVTEEGIPRDIPIEETAGHVIVREMMVLANFALAEICSITDQPIIYRSHYLNQDLDLAGLVAQNGNHELDFAKVNLLRSMMGLVVPRARYDISPHHHAGLGLPMYTHATSPLRRRVDMIVHRQIKAWLRKNRYPYDRDQLVEMVVYINSRAEETDEDNAYLHRRWSPSVKVSAQPRGAISLYAQQLNVPLPQYTVVAVDHNGNNHRYEYACTLANLTCTGTGHSPREAKDNAARAVWRVLFRKNRGLQREDLEGGSP